MPQCTAGPDVNKGDSGEESRQSRARGVDAQHPPVWVRTEGVGVGRVEGGAVGRDEEVG